MTLKSTIYWGVMPHCLIEVHQHSPPKSGNFFQTTGYYIPAKSTFLSNYNCSSFIIISCTVINVWEYYLLTLFIALIRNSRNLHLKFLWEVLEFEH